MAPNPTGPTIRPSAWWYAVTLGVGAFAMVVAAVVLLQGFREAKDTPDESTRLEVGVVSPVTFDRVDSFTLYYLGPTQVSTTSEIPDFAGRVGAVLTPEMGGPAVVLERYEGATAIQNSNSGGQSVALGTFRITEPGDYRFSSNPIAGTSTYDAQLVITTSPYRPLKRGAVVALGALAGGSVISLIASVALGVTRGRAKRAAALQARLRAAGPLGGGWPGQGGPVVGGWPVGSPGGPGMAGGSGPPPGWRGPAPIIPPPPPGYGPDR